jgi:hypothetical protein
VALYEMLFSALGNSEEHLTIRDQLMREHVPYEIAMLRATLDALSAVEWPPLFRNILIESFAIHARVLIDFFNGKGGSDAKHFVNATYVPFAAGKVPDRLTRKLNQQVAHITERRVSGATDKLNGEDMIELRVLLDAEIAEFLRRMTPHYRALWDAGRQLAY